MHILKCYFKIIIITTNNTNVIKQSERHIIFFYLVFISKKIKRKYIPYDQNPVSSALYFNFMLIYIAIQRDNHKKSVQILLICHYDSFCHCIILFITETRFTPQRSTFMNL